MNSCLQKWVSPVFTNLAKLQKKKKSICDIITYYLKTVPEQNGSHYNIILVDDQIQKFSNVLAFVYQVLDSSSVPIEHPRR